MRGLANTRLSSPAKAETERWSNNSSASRGPSAVVRRGLSVEVVGPYLAEVDYELRRPDEVRRQVKGFAESARLRPGLAMIVERWT